MERGWLSTVRCSFSFSCAGPQLVVLLLAAMDPLSCRLGHITSKSAIAWCPVDRKNFMWRPSLAAQPH